MKRFLFVSLIMAAVAAVFTFIGCASSSGGGPAGDDVIYEWFITREEGGLRANYNQVKTRKGETFIYCYFPPRGADFEKIKIDFTIDKAVEVIWQCAYQDGIVAGAEIPVGIIDKGPIETSFEKFILYWYRYDSSEVLETSRIKGICLKIIDPDGGAVFQMSDVSFIGLAE